MAITSNSLQNTKQNLTLPYFIVVTLTTDNTVYVKGGIKNLYLSAINLNINALYVIKNIYRNNK